MKVNKITQNMILVAILIYIFPYTIFATETTLIDEKGQATVSEAIKSGNREFFTIVTPSQQTYYLIVDFQEKERNVYFLKAVDEIDLLDLAGVGEVIYNQEETTRVLTEEITTETQTEIETEETSDIVEDEEEKPKIDILLILGIVILVVALFLFIKNKKDNKKKEDIYLEEAIDDEDDEIVFKQDKDNLEKLKDLDI